MNWPEYPMLRISICFILGIYLSDRFGVRVEDGLIGILTTAGSYIFVSRFIEESRFSARLMSILISALGVGLGIFCLSLHNVKSDPLHFEHYIQKENVFIGQISAEVKKKKRVSTVLEVHQIDEVPASGKLLLYFGKLDSLIDYEVGDIIKIKGRAQKLKDNANPNAFNYKTYLKYKGIASQIFLKDNSHELISKGGRGEVKSIAHGIRKWALSIFEKRIKEKDKLAVASAMVLGYKDHLSSELYTTFSETGAVHVLAVSGLHVGIICMLFFLLFNRFQSEHLLYKLVKFVVLMIVVWTYALVTGASPAVMRAAVMFSLILMGRLWFRGVNIYNILAFSAFLLLLYDPYLLFQLSFQFSYLALISIIYFQPRIERLYETKHWLTTKVWQLISVSIAAQILMFPISIYYFHSLPTYFILSGVAAVFLATFILGFGLMLLVADSIPFLGDVISFLYSSLLEGFLNIISTIQSLPYNSIDRIYFSTSSVLVLYILLLTFMFRLSVQPNGFEGVLYKKIKQKRIAIWMMIGCIFFLMVNHLKFDYRVNNHSELIIYDVSKTTVIDIFDGDILYTIASETVDEKKIDFATRAYRIFHGSPKEVTSDANQNYQNERFQVNSTGLILIEDQILYIADQFNHSQKIPCFSDYLLVTHSTRVKPRLVLKYHSCQKVVLDSSIGYKMKQKWKKECEKLGIPVHDIYEDGIFRIKF